MYYSSLFGMRLWTCWELDPQLASDFEGNYTLDRHEPPTLLVTTWSYNVHSGIDKE